MPLLSCLFRTSLNSSRLSPPWAAFSSSPSPAGIFCLWLFLVLNLGSYDFHGNGFHSTSSVPIFLIFVVQALQEFLNKLGYFPF